MKKLSLARCVGLKADADLSARRKELRRRFLQQFYIDRFCQMRVHSRQQTLLHVLLEGVCGRVGELYRIPEDVYYHLF